MKYNYQVTTGDECSLWLGLYPGTQYLLAEEVPREHFTVVAHRKGSGAELLSWDLHLLPPSHVTLIR